MEKSFDPEWEKIHASRDVGRYPAEYVIRYMVRNFPDEGSRKHVKVLDFCCGSGRHTWYLARSGFDTFAFDGSKSAIERTKLLLKEEKLDVELKIADALNVEYPAQSFDVVIDNLSVLSNKLADINAMYKKIYGFLKPGGKLLTAAFSKKHAGYVAESEIEPGTISFPDHGYFKGRKAVHFYEKEEFRSVLESNGFEDISMETEYREDDLDGWREEIFIAKATRKADLL